MVGCDRSPAIAGRKAEGRKSRDTASLTYRCFLPDLTRFVSVCCAGSGPNALYIKGKFSREGFKARLLCGRHYRTERMGIQAQMFLRHQLAEPVAALIIVDFDRRNISFISISMCYIAHTTTWPWAAHEHRSPCDHPSNRKSYGMPRMDIH